MAAPDKARIRANRQDELRAKLAAGGHLQQVLKNIDKINDLDVKEKTFKNSIDKLRTTTDYHLKLITKYLPDLKSTELTGDGGGPLIAKSFNDMYD